MGLPERYVLDSEVKHMEKYIGGYRIVRQLGEGATAKVFLAEHVDTRAICAVKLGTDAVLIHRESQILRALTHRAFPTWMGEATAGEEHFLFMEYIEGESLAERLKAGAPMETEAFDIMREVLGALAYLHGRQKPILYLDLKPEHLILPPGGGIRIVDLGAARYLDDRGIRAGNRGYAAPEQLLAEGEVGTACDIYGAGKLFAYLMTGKNPCEPPYDTLELCERNRRLPEQVKRLLRRSLAQTPEGRYSDAAEFLRELERAGKRHGGGKLRLLPYFSRKTGKYIYEKCIWKSDYRELP